ncbi:MULTISPECIES: D-alanine--D-alanine ligase [unclassified Streptomyces]|uniref:D-alanine--D-alanine ligase family protein n=1 Tax=unclassified Streptomyces TaxID=2593676 RepID=UPI00381E10AE
MTIPLVSQDDYPKGVVVITGGWSAERHRSLLSGRAVVSALQGMGVQTGAVDLRDDRHELSGRLDGAGTVFLAIAGRGGEDGRLQGYLETRGLDYTGSGVLASAISMHKLTAKAVVQAAGVLTPTATPVSREVKGDTEAARVVGLLGPDIIVKPVNEGCSVGVRLPRGIDELREALLDGFTTDLMAETYHRGRSVSVGVLEDETGRLDTLPAIEAETGGRIYTQAAKENSDQCVYRCPAPLADEVEAAVREQAVAAHRALGCHSYSRHDFIVTPDGQALWLEANSLPGLSHQGNLARMARAAGISYEQLVSHILRGARTDRRAHA